MRILHLVGVVPPGGWGSALLATELSLGLKKWHDIESIMVGKYSNAPELKTALEQAGLPIIDAHMCSAREKPGEFIDAIVRTCFATFGKKIDLVHTNAHVGGARFAASLKKLPYVIWMLNAPIVPTSTALERVRKKMFLSAYKNAAKVVTISEYLRRDIVEKLGNHKLGIATIPPGLDLDEFSPGKPKTIHPLLQQAKQNGALICGLVGRIDHAKCTMDVVPLAKACKQAGLNIVFALTGSGTKTGSCEGELRQAVLEAGLENNVIFLGTVSNIVDIYRQIDLLIHLCPIEGFGRIFVEAMGAKLPVVGAAIAGSAIYEVVEDQTTGFICQQHDWVKWINALRVLQDKEKRIVMGEAGRKVVLEKFSIRAMCDQWANLYKSVIHSI